MNSDHIRIINDDLNISLDFKIFRVSNNEGLIPYKVIIHFVMNYIKLVSKLIVKIFILNSRKDLS